MEEDKMCSPLRGKIVKFGDYPSFDFSDVKSAVEFYMRYRDDIDLLYREQRASYVYWIPLKPKRGSTDWYMYRDWLFDYCFGDVIE